jgi:hypothetical protein
MVRIEKAHPVNPVHSVRKNHGRRQTPELTCKYPLPCRGEAQRRQMANLVADNPFEIPQTKSFQAGNQSGTVSGGNVARF